MYIIKLCNKNVVMRLLLQVVLVANSLPALNDLTAMELPEIVAEAAKVGFKHDLSLLTFFSYILYI